MKPFFTVQEIKTIDFIPDERLGQLAQIMDQILKNKVARNDDNDKEWSEFLESQELRLVKNREVTPPKMESKKVTDTGTKGFTEDTHEKHPTHALRKSSATEKRSHI